METELEVSKSTKRSGPKDEARYAHLTRLFIAAEDVWPARWGQRSIQASFEDEFFAVSWQGDRAYLRGQAWEEAEARIAKDLKRRRQAGIAPRDLVELRKRLRAEAVETIHERFEPKDDGPYAYECFVFFKSSNLVPPSLVEMAPNCQQAFLDAPLHNHLIISRHQPAVDREEKPVFTNFQALEETPRTQAEVVELLLKRIYPEKCPMKEDKKEAVCVWCWMLTGCLALMLILIGAFLLWEGNRQRVMDYLGWVDAAVVEELQERHDRLLDDYAALARERRDVEVITAGEDNHAQLAAIDAQLRELAAAIRAEGGQVPGPLGLRPCMDSADVRASNTPVYLYDITLGPAGLQVSEPAGGYAIGPDERRHADFPGALPAAGIYTPERFAAVMRPLFRQGRERGCAYYVLLRDGELNSRDGYIDQRNAVEGLFNVYRPRP